MRDGVVVAAADTPLRVCVQCTTLSVVVTLLIDTQLCKLEACRGISMMGC